MANTPKHSESTDPKVLTIARVSKSFYCKCFAPMVRTSINGYEYCALCQLDIEQ